MSKRKILNLLILLSLTFLATGCGQKQVNMNELAADGQYHYENRDLGFGLVLPKDFIYYQTQRSSGSGFTDLEFYVPTADTDYEQPLPNYAKPIVVRIFANESEWQKQERQTTDTENFLKRVGERKGKIYTMIFWETIPADWRQIWNEEYREMLVSNFKIM